MKSVTLISLFLIFSLFFTFSSANLFNFLEKHNNNQKLSLVSKKFDLSSSSSDFVCPSYTCGLELNQTCNSNGFCSDSIECNLCSDSYCENQKCSPIVQVNETCTNSDQCAYLNPFIQGRCVEAYNSSETTCQFIFEAGAGEKCGFTAGIEGESGCVNGLPCIDGICVGKGEGESCQGLQCNKGLYCSSEGKCTLAVPLGGFCEEFDECAADVGHVSICMNNTCAIPYSKKLGESCVHNDECQLAGLYCSSEGKCTSVSLSEFEIPCTDSSNCTFSEFNDYTGYCRCPISSSSSDSGFCSSPDSAFNIPVGQRAMNAYGECLNRNNCSLSSPSCAFITCGTSYWCTYLELVENGYEGKIENNILGEECIQGIDFIRNLRDQCSEFYSSSSEGSQSESNEKSSENNVVSGSQVNSGSNVNSENQNSSNNEESSEKNFATQSVVSITFLFFISFISFIFFI